MCPESPLETNLQDRLRRLNEIGVALSAERDLHALLRLILLEARLFTRADAGTLYLVGQKVLTFEITQNDTFGEDDAHWEEEKQIPPVPLDRKSASGYAAITGEVLNIDDVYTDTVHAFEGPRKYEDILVKSRQRKTPETVDLNTLIQRELEFLQADFTFKHEVKSDVQLAPGLPSFECVYTDFSQAIGNLLRNALDAMHSRDEKELRVHTREQDGVIYIEIRDTGSGHPPPFRTVLYYQSQRTKRRRALGHGAGTIHDKTSARALLGRSECPERAGGRDDLHAGDPAGPEHLIGQSA